MLILKQKCYNVVEILYRNIEGHKKVLWTMKKTILHLDDIIYNWLLYKQIASLNSGHSIIRRNIKEVFDQNIFCFLVD